MHLKELALCWCNKVTDDGISMVIIHCIQLHVLNLEGLKGISGMCDLCEEPELTFCFITLSCTIFLQQVHH